MHKIDLTNIKTKEEFHKLIKEELDFPEYYGNNLDAFYDLLTEIAEPLEIEFLMPSADAGFSPEMDKLLKGLHRMAEDVCEECDNISIEFTDVDSADSEETQFANTIPPREQSNARGNNMEFRDLKKQYQVLKEDIDQAMIKVATDCNFISGNQVKELEEQLADFVGAKHCITCANGTDALSIAMMVWGLGQGDAVFVPDFTFFSSGEIVSHCGATPIFVDVDERTFNIDLDSLKSAIAKVKSEGALTPKAVVAVDLFGLPADLWEIKEICQEEGLYLLEDGAQGFGGSITKDGDIKMACSFGDISTTSFFPAKPLGCYGDGGAIFTDNDEWAELIRSICVHGKGEMKYDNVRIGLNSRLDTLQAGILQVKLQAFDDYELEDVNLAATFYDNYFSDFFDAVEGEKKVYSTEKGEIKLPVIPEGYNSGWAQYTIQLDNKEIRDGLQAALKEEGIPTMIYYIKPMHKQLAFGLPADYQFPCPVTEKLCETVLSLPIHPYLSEEDAERVVKAIKKYMD